MRTASFVAMLAVAAFVGSSLLRGRGRAVRYGLAIVYAAVILAFVLYSLFGG
ncbi:MAG TPA: hypothetical protein VHB27_03515 [Rhodopila sp.]|uniref:hypothetical protein n=1 Tax=Rhodopila sp. TaxID=2480087 RepID=UPI002B9CC02A|nr:hypothetical protein [Rhodopila sp.]HVY14271.1 hypothetical protein [Rhodopila sp.]